jgi:hypothetical protein
LLFWQFQSHAPQLPLGSGVGEEGVIEGAVDGLPEGVCDGTMLGVGDGLFAPPP